MSTTPLYTEADLDTEIDLFKTAIRALATAMLALFWFYGHPE
jgi:heme/copper-type cytochrome/quinol oxidase subunit 1